MKTSFLFASVLFLWALFSVQVSAAPDPNFHIYIAFGQSNMEGQATVIDANKVKNDRFQVLASVTCSNMGRTLGQWAVAVPPLFHCYTGLSPADYFGKTMADSLPGITIGVIPVAVAGTAIKLFDKAQYSSYLPTTESYLQQKAADYGGNPYGRIIDLAKEAQKVGVIKGILMHQGETDGYNDTWATTVKKVYTDMLTDLSLSADTVPFIAGEVLSPGQCSDANSQINALPNKISTAHVVSSSGCTGGSDNLHFDNAGYQELGKRYAKMMLSLLKRSPSLSSSSSSVISSSSSSATELTPFKSHSIPGTIEAEDYDNGGQNIAYYDIDTENETTLYRADNAGIDSAGSAFVYGWAQNGEWLKYTVNVTEAGMMQYTVRIASANDNASFSLYMDDTAIADNITVPNTSGWKTFQEISDTTSTISAGTHVLKVSVDAAYFNIDWIKFEKLGTTGITKALQGIQTRKTNYAVYNLNGKRIAVFTAKNTGVETAWNKVRTRLPSGIYLLKNISTGSIRKISNSTDY